MSDRRERVGWGGSWAVLSGGMEGTGVSRVFGRFRDHYRSLATLAPDMSRGQRESDALPSSRRCNRRQDRDTPGDFKPEVTA